MSDSLKRLLALLCLLFPCVALAGSGSLPEPVTRLLKKWAIPANSLSIYIRDVRKDRPMLAFNADQPRNPASAIKAVTTFVALDALGPAYTWETAAYAGGPMREGYLEGDLVLKGTGDPFLVNEYLWKFVRGLRDTGLEHIAGDLVIDNSYFDPGVIDPAEFDGKPHYSYNAQPDALLINFQTVEFRFEPDPVNHNIQITTSPRLANLEVENGLKYKTGVCRGHMRRLRMDVDDRDSGSKVRFSGAYPEGCGVTSLSRVIMNPQAKAYGAFLSLWQEMGGTLEGTLRSGAAPDDARRLYRQKSRPLAEIIRGVNKYSNNVMARHLLLTLGAQRYGAPGTYEKGRNAIEAWLGRNHMDFPELNLDNGAGLSRETRISARSMGELLWFAYRSRFQPEFVASLPVAGMDGTMHRRFRRSPVKGHAHIKTGTLDDVRAAAGYVLTAGARRYVVVVMQNGRGVRGGRGRAIQDALLEWLYRQ